MSSLIVESTAAGPRPASRPDRPRAPGPFSRTACNSVNSSIGQPLGTRGSPSSASRSAVSIAIRGVSQTTSVRPRAKPPRPDRDRGSLDRVGLSRSDHAASSNAPSKTLPSPPSTVITLPSSAAATPAPQPTTAGLPISRLTTAAWDVAPPISVTIARAASIPATSSGLSPCGPGSRPRPRRQRRARRRGRCTPCPM